MGDVSVLLQPVPGDGREIQVGGAAGPRLRPLRFGERWAIVTDANATPDPAGALGAMCLAASTLASGRIEPTLARIVALHLAGACRDAPPLSDCAVVAARLLGWGPDQLARADANMVDDLARQLCVEAPVDDGWTTFELAEPAARDEGAGTSEPTLDDIERELAARLLLRAEPRPATAVPPQGAAVVGSHPGPFDLRPELSLGDEAALSLEQRFEARGTSIFDPAALVDTAELRPTDSAPQLAVDLVDRFGAHAAADPGGSRVPIEDVASPESTATRSRSTPTTPAPEPPTITLTPHPLVADPTSPIPGTGSDGPSTGSGWPPGAQRAPQSPSSSPPLWPSLPPGAALVATPSGPVAPAPTGPIEDRLAPRVLSSAALGSEGVGELADAVAAELDRICDLRGLGR